MQVDDESVPLKRLNSDPGPPPAMETITVKCPHIGTINVHMQGTRSSKEVVILTVHDLGCDHTMYQEFVDHPKMVPIKNRTVWVHVEIPGQGLDAPDLPQDYQFPSMQQIAEDMIAVVDELKIKEVVCFGEGAGANILTRFAMAHSTRVMGVVLLHATGTTAGFFESIKDRFMGWKLDHSKMNQSAENYLVLHRFGATTFSKATDKDELRAIVQAYHDSLRTRVNYKNLSKFVDAFLKRTSFYDSVKNLTCPVLLITGQHSVFNGTTKSLHQAIAKASTDKTKVEFIEVAEVANVLEEKPDKIGECLQYFLQGLGLISSVPMHNVHKMLRNRTLSMEDYDKPMKDRKNSLTCGSDNENAPSTPTASSPTNPLPPIGQGQELKAV